MMMSFIQYLASRNVFSQGCESACRIMQLEYCESDIVLNSNVWVMVKVQYNTVQ